MLGGVAFSLLNRLSLCPRNHHVQPLDLLRPSASHLRIWNRWARPPFLAAVLTTRIPLICIPSTTRDFSSCTSLSSNGRLFMPPRVRSIRGSGVPRHCKQGVHKTMFVIIMIAEKMTRGVRSFLTEHDVSVCTRENDAREARAVCSLVSGFGFPALLTPNQSRDTITKRRVVRPLPISTHNRNTPGGSTAVASEANSPPCSQFVKSPNSTVPRITYV